MLHVAYVVKQTTMHARMTVSLSSKQQLHSNWRSHLLHEWKQAGVPRMSLFHTLYALHFIVGEVVAV